MADHDPTRIDEVMDWPLRDLLLAYLERVKTLARETYEADLLMWAVLAAAGGKMKRPEPPAVLRLPKLVIGG